MTQEILVIYGMIECHLMAKHKACYFTGAQNYATLNGELIFIHLTLSHPLYDRHWMNRTPALVGSQRVLFIVMDTRSEKNAER